MVLSEGKSDALIIKRFPANDLSSLDALLLESLDQEPRLLNPLLPTLVTPQLWSPLTKRRPKLLPVHTTWRLWSRDLVLVDCLPRCSLCDQVDLTFPPERKTASEALVVPLIYLILLLEEISIARIATL